MRKLCTVVDSIHRLRSAVSMVSLYNFPLYSFPNKRLNLSIWLFDTLSSIKLCSHLFALYFSADLFYTNQQNSASRCGSHAGSCV